MPEQRESIQIVARGQNGRLDPAVLSPDYVSRLYNVSIRDGLARSRPGLSEETCPVQGRFQGVFEYRLDGRDYWVVVVAGQVWLYRAVTQVWAYLDTFPTIDFDKAYFVQADRYVIVQNGIYNVRDGSDITPDNWPIIFHETTLIDNLNTQFFAVIDEELGVEAEAEFTRIGNLPEADTLRVPIGTAMAYGHGRLFVAVDHYYENGKSGANVGWRTGLGKRFWVAGDVIQPDNVESILAFSEGQYLAEGSAFSLPAEMGFITSMGFLRNAETGSGLGALIVFAKRGAAAFSVNSPRSQGAWLSQGFGQVLFTSSGTRSPWALIPVNSDLVYYGEDGLRTLKYSASTEAGSGGLATMPLSPEVYNFTRLTRAETHESYVTLAHVDNYLFFTAGGAGLPDGSCAFYGILPWDLLAFQVSGEVPNRVFAGAWCGKLFHAVIPSRGEINKLSVFYRNVSDGPLLYGTFAKEEYSFVCSVHTMAFQFQDATILKRVKHIDAMFDDVRGPLTVWVRWRADGNRTWSVSDARKFTGAGGSTGLFRIPVAPDHSAVGHLVQFAVEWQGNARFKLALFTAALLERFEGNEQGELCEETDVGIGPSEAFDCPVPYVELEQLP